ncbi:MAG: hypothetical protein DRN04_15935 [Thermoprotei archaeon]|nr:MAG: hypothetical protein DRN04_15935 [Thermoprotei archaeon]
MEESLTKLLIVVVSIAITVAVIGIFWSMYTMFSTTHDFAVSNPVIYDFGGSRRILVLLRNTGTVPFTKIELDPDNDGKYEVSVSASVKQGEEYQVDGSFTDSVTYPKQPVAIKVTFADGKTVVKVVEFPVRRG